MFDRKKLEERLKNIQPYFTLALAIIGVFGGVPGIREMLVEPRVRIDLSKSNVVAAEIRSTSSTFSRKVAILFYRLQIAGNSKEDFFLSEVKASLRCDGNWMLGKQFSPVQVVPPQTAPNLGKVIHLFWSRPGPELDDVYVANWRDFRPIDKVQLKFGEPASFSYGAFFDLYPEKAHSCDRLRVEVTDYLGNSERVETGAEELLGEFPEYGIDADNG